ncbi:hypothetical protein [Desulfovibrio inopinatus]|uniref:hypothetical protein n=1 Tax=Desulfovibrio inopinatus TaxID=102109 RepID=UPI000401353D|nr:hypothetical protein [Desulfovibrio inopinatus]
MTRFVARKTMLAGLATLVVMLVEVVPAYAYVDPNLGNAIFQILFPVLTVLSTVLLVFRNSVRRVFHSIKSLFTRNSSARS